MFYELFAIARVADPLNTKKDAVRLVSTIGKMILNNRGIIKDIKNLGVKPLYKIIKKNNEKNFQGFHFLIGFYASASVQSQLLNILKKDPRIISAGIKKHDIKKNLTPDLSYINALNLLSH